MEKQIKKIPWLFLLLSFAISWAVWIPVAFTGQDYQSSPYLLAAVLVGGFGPGFAAIILNFFSKDLEQAVDFRQRIYQFSRIRPSWILIILALWPTVHSIAIGLTRVFGGSIPESPFLKEILKQPNTIPLVLFLYLLQALIEELGWRGYLLEKLTQAFGPSLSSILVGIIHVIWHLPLFWVVGTNQIQMGFGVDFLFFIGFVIASSVYSAWCYLDNNRSILAASLLSTTASLSFDIFAYAPGTLKHQIFVALLIFGAVGILIFLQTQSKRTPS
jgi:membrane protease YdiL (CAAX protease family)